MKNIIIALILVFLISACNSSDKNTSGENSLSISKENLSDADVMSIIQLSGQSQLEVAGAIVQLARLKGLTNKAMANALDAEIDLICEQTCTIERK